jgi:hypothetical protein
MDDPLSERLAIMPLSDDAYINAPEEIDRFLVRVWPDGTLYFKGSRRRIEEFLRLCEEMGIPLSVDHIALCG